MATQRFAQIQNLRVLFYLRVLFLFYLFRVSVRIGLHALTHNRFYNRFYLFSCFTFFPSKLLCFNLNILQCFY